MGTDHGQRPSNAGPASSAYDVFISYANADRAWVDGFLIDGLERAGVRCHREAAFALGVPRLAEFENAVRSSGRILLVLSPAYFSSDTASFVDLLAQTYGLETATWPVIPLRLEPVTLPTRLAMLTALDASDPDERERVIEKLSNLFQRPIPAAPPRPVCPYPGMRAFTLDDGFPFFGRDRECEELLQHLRQSRFLTVIGGSGSGKSSLVFAGLVPRLRKTNLFGPGKWIVRSMRPGERPLVELARALGADPADPAAAVAHALEADPEAKRLLLVVDQFEEVFAVSQGKPEPVAHGSLGVLGGEATPDQSNSEQLCQALVGLMNLESVAVALTVRADFYAELMGTPLWPQIKANRVDVGPLDEAGLRDAIYRPAETVGVYVESALVERLASDALEARSLGILPLVQEVLVQLWEKLERRVLPLHAYAEFVLPRRAYDHPNHGQARTGLEIAIARHADGVVKRLEVENPAQVEIARRIFVRLVQFGEGRPDTRRQQSVAQLRAGNDPVRFETTLKALASNRLITLTGDRETGRRRADIAHEALIRGWPQLQCWIEESRKAEEVRRKLERKAHEWIDSGAGREGLLGTGGLVEAEGFLASPDGRELPDDDSIRLLIRESGAEIHRAEIEREAARQRELANAQQRVKILLRSAAFLAILLVGLVGVTIFAVHARRQAKLNQVEAEKQARIAADNQTKAEANEAEAHESLRVASQGIDDLLTEVADVDLADVPQMEQVRRRLLEKAHDAYQELLKTDKAVKEPVLRWVEGKARSRMGEIREMMGEFAMAEQIFLQAIDQLAALSAQFPENADYRRDLVRSHIGLGVLYKKSNRFEDADSQLNAAFGQSAPLATSSALLDRQMLAEIDYQRAALWARQEDLLGRLRSPMSDRAKKSDEAYRAALRVQRELVKEYRERPELRAKLGRYLNNLGKFLAKTDKADEAEKTFLEAIELILPRPAHQITGLWSEQEFREAIERVQGSTPLSPGERWQLARNVHNLGLLFSQQNRLDHGVRLLETSKEYLEKRSQEFPKVLQYRQELAAVYHTLGQIAVQEKQSTKAQVNLKRARDVDKELVDQSPAEVIPDLRLDLAIADLDLASCLEQAQPVGESAAARVVARADLLASAESATREAIEQLNMLAAGRPGVPDYAKVHLGRAYLQLAKRLDFNDKRQEARRAAEQAIHFHEAALELSPGNRQYQRSLWDDYLLFSLILLKLPDQTERVTQAAFELPRLRPLDPESYLNAAYFLARCATASKDQGRDYGGQAVQLLKKGVEKGLFGDEKQLNSRKLDLLKDRDDFKELRQSLVAPRPG